MADTQEKLLAESQKQTRLLEGILRNQEAQMSPSELAAVSHPSNQPAAQERGVQEPQNRLSGLRSKGG